MAAAELIGDRFELGRLVGRGGMGDVFHATDRHTGEAVAIKILLQVPMGPALERWRREVQLLAEIRDARTVRYVAHGVGRDGRPFLAMEWLEGQELAERLTYGPLAIGEAVALAHRIAEGLSVLHARGVVHRDIKPSNVFLVGGSVERAKLLDFGVARLADAALRATKSGVIVGTPGYMAPEQARGDAEIDARVDVYALGCVLYECLAGEPLFPGTNMVAILAKILMGETPRIRSVRRDASKELEALLARMLARNPVDRPSDGAAVAAELQRLPGAAAIASAPSLPPARESRSITHTERRLVSVLLVSGGVTASASPPTASTGVDETVAATLDPRLVASQFSAAVEPLADGSLVVVLAGRGTATDQAARAARCALELRRLLPRCPMALATGLASSDSELAAREVIDRAAELLIAAPSPGVRLDDVTAGLLGQRFEISGDSVGLVLEGPRDDQTLPRTILGKSMPFLGRERELQSLMAVIRESDEDSCARPVLVTAGPGVGKTRLAQELLQLTRKEGRAELWFARGDAISEGSTFSLLGQALRSAAGILDGEPLLVRQMKLRARVVRNVAEPERERITEFLAEIIGAPFTEGISVSLRAARQDARLMGDQMRAALEDFVLAECKEKPLVLILEDLQWGDLPSVRYIDAVLRNLESEPIAVVAFGRPETEELFPGLWKERNLTELRLAPLSKRAAEAFVKAALGDAASPDRVRLILERAAGNAFFLEELVRAAAEGNDDFPGSVLAMVESRLSRLDGGERRVLRAAAVFGLTFWERGVGTLLGAERAVGVSDSLRELRNREITDRSPTSSILGEEEYTFRHALVREAAYATLTPADRALGHKLAAEWLEARGGNDPAVLAEHYELGGDRERACRWYAAAAAHAHEADDFASANGYAEKALASGAEGADVGKLRFMQASGCLWAGNLDDALRFGREAMTLLDPSDSTWFIAAGAMASIAVRQQEMAVLAEVATRLEGLLGNEPLAAPRVLGACRVAGSLFYGGLVERGNALLARVEAGGAKVIADDPIASAWVHYARSMRATVRSDPEDEHVALERAVVAFDAVGDRRNACLHRVNMGAGLQNLGMLELAEEHLRKATADAERMGLGSLALAAKHNLGAALSRQGLVEEGIVLEREAALGFAKVGDRFLEGVARAYLATMLRVAGRLDEAKDELTRTLLRFTDLPHARAPLLAQLAMVEVEMGNGERALELAKEAGRLANDGAVFEGESYIRLSYAEALFATGRVEEAKAAIVEARAQLLARAEKIRDAGWRAAFLGRVRENVQTLARAREWLGESS